MTYPTLARILTCAVAGALLGASGRSVPELQDEDPPGAPGALSDAFARAGLHFDAEAGLLAVPVSVEVTNELLEYLLVAPHGAAHESLLLTGVDPQILNAAFLALGVTPGTNASWEEKDPPPTEEELRQGASPYEVVAPTGDGLYLYVGWREGDETFFFRAEDLIRDLDRGRTMRRQAWTFLGSAMMRRGEDGPELFAASAEGNLINVSFFSAGHTLLTGTTRDCIKQTVWLPNAWLLPPRGSELRLVASRARLDAPPASLAGILPLVEEAPR